MNRCIALTVAYDGTDFSGWQLQPAAQGISVQRVLEDALRALTGAPVRVHGAGRTDAGVHALGQCCHFDCEAALPVDKLPLIINRRLPPGVRVLSARETEPGFHARLSAAGKHYRYVLERGAAPSPFTGRYSWQVAEELDVAAMRAAAACLVGEHDFRHFTVSGASARNFVRRLYSLRLSEPPPAELPLPWQQLARPLLIDAVGSGFLYKMMRIIVGRLVAIGRGQLLPEAMQGYLDGSVHRNIPPAPPRGLMLMTVYYTPPDRE